MITDAQLLLSDAQAITGDANSTNVIDLGSTQDVARGYNLRCRIQVQTALDSAGEAATLNIKVVTSAAAALTSPTTLYDSGVITEATLSTAGYIIADFVLPRTALRYLGIIYDDATEAFTSGNITAEILLDTETAPADRVLGENGI
jgi:hypothetical protein